MKKVKIGNRLRDLLFKQPETIVKKGSLCYYLGECYKVNPHTEEELLELSKKLFKTLQKIL